MGQTLQVDDLLSHLFKMMENISFPTPGSPPRTTIFMGLSKFLRERKNGKIYNLLPADNRLIPMVSKSQTMLLLRMPPLQQ